MKMTAHTGFIYICTYACIFVHMYNFKTTETFVVTMKMWIILQV